jgi:hypothetical protein
MTWWARWFLAIAGGFVAASSVGSGQRVEAQSGPALSLTSPLGGFQRPTHVTHAGDGSGRLFVAEQAGRIRVVKDGAILPEPFLDIRARVGNALNGVAFPPGYAGAGHFYVQYQDGDCATVVARYRVSADPDVADPGSEAVVIRVPGLGYCGHDGGAPVFGPDGYLYVSLGDGTQSGAATNPAQDPGSLRGKMLRIDVEGAGAAAYVIPPTNPYAATPGVAPEIWPWACATPGASRSHRPEISTSPTSARAGARKSTSSRPEVQAARTTAGGSWRALSASPAPVATRAHSACPPSSTITGTAAR